MPASTEPRSGVKWGWTLGENGWKTDVDANWLMLGRLAVPNLYVIDRDLTAPPGSPVDGDAYIPAATATGDWAGHEDDIAVWDGSTWVFYTPVEGWLCVMNDEGKLCRYTGSAWSTGIAI